MIFDDVCKENKGLVSVIGILVNFWMKYYVHLCYVMMNYCSTRYLVIYVFFEVCLSELMYFLCWNLLHLPKTMCEFQCKHSCNYFSLWLNYFGCYAFGYYRGTSTWVQCNHANQNKHNNLCLAQSGNKRCDKYSSKGVVRRVALQLHSGCKYAI